MMKVIAECSTRATLTMQGWREKLPNGALQVGTLCHHVVQRHLCGATPEDNLGTFDTEYEGYRTDWLFEEEHLSKYPQYSRYNIRTAMEQWLLRHPADNPFPPLKMLTEWVEIPFEVPLDAIEFEGDEYQVVFTGQLDALAEDNDDIVTVEVKTVGKIKDWWKMKFEGDAQNTGYQYAAEVTTGRRIVGTYLVAIETGKIPDSTRTCYTHTYNDIPHVEPGNTNYKTLHKATKGDITFHPAYFECGYLHANSEVFFITRNPELTVQWRKDVMSFAYKYLELQKYVGQGIIGATKTRTQGKFHDSCMFCPYRNWCIRSARNPEFAESMMAHNTEVRDVRVGILTEEQFHAKV
jgi:hypothetical protein